MKRIEILESEKKVLDESNFSLEQKRLSEINSLNLKVENLKKEI